MVLIWVAGAFVLAGIFYIWLVYCVMSEKACGEVVDHEPTASANMGDVVPVVRFYAKHGTAIRFKSSHAHGEAKQLSKVKVRYCKRLPRLCCVDCWWNRYIVPGFFFLVAIFLLYMMYSDYVKATG